MRTEDGYIIYKCLKGDSAAFGLLVDKYKASIYGLAYSKLGNFHDAEDVAQEVFIKAYENLRSLKRWESFLAWLYSITSNLCKNWIRARSRRPDRESIEDKDPETLRTLSMDTYRDELARESLRDALDSLPEMYRQVLTLYYLSGMSSTEIARFLGTPPGTVRQRLNRARAQLKEEMLAMMSRTYEKQRLQATFTFRILEAVKWIKIQPMPRTTALPWGLSVATGIILTILSFGSHLNLTYLTGALMDSPPPSEIGMMEAEEIPVDVLKTSRMSFTFGGQGYDDGREPERPDEHNAVLPAPRGEGEIFAEEPAASMGKGTVHWITYSPDGTLIALATGTGVHLYNADDLTEAGLLEGHNSPVWRVAFSPDGKLLASVGYDDSMIRLWDMGTQEEIAVIRGQTKYMYSVAFSPDGKLIAWTGWGNDNAIRLWDVETKKEVGALKGHTDMVDPVAFNPDGKLIASGSRDKTARLWDVDTRSQIAELKGNKEGVSSVCFSPDGRLLATGGWDETLRLWDVEDKSEIIVLKEDSGSVYNVSFSPDGKQLVSGHSDGNIRLWDMDRKEEIATFSGHSSAGCASFSPDGKSIASVDRWGRHVYFWDVAEREQIAELKEYSGCVWSVPFSPDGKLLISGEDEVVRLWDVNERKQVGELGGIHTASLSADGKTLASGGPDNTIILWDVERREELAVMEGHTDKVWEMAFSPDGKLLASASYDDTVGLWDVEKKENIDMLRGHTGAVCVVTFSPDGKLLASGGYEEQRDCTVRLWHVQRREQLAVLHGHTNTVTGLDFSPDGNLLASGAYDGTIRLWDVQPVPPLMLRPKTPKQIAIINTYAMDTLRFSPDGKFIISGERDNTIKIWDVTERKRIAVLTGHTWPISCLSFSPDRRLLASGSLDGSILLWEVNLPGTHPVEPEEKQLVTWGKVKRTELFQNFPNPFNPETWIPFSLSKSEYVIIRIYSSTGQLVRTLDLGERSSGTYLSKENAAYWDGRNEAGEAVASDVYFYAMEAGESTDLRKMVMAP